MALSRYRVMWFFVLFDLPVESGEQRREAARFRKMLQKKGFTMLQYSVYAKHIPSEDAVAPLKTVIRMGLPAEGQVRLMAVTDHQFAKMEVFTGRKRRAVEDPPMQIMLF
jgi:CRISPR-associated protein Cas2